MHMQGCMSRHRSTNATELADRVKGEGSVLLVQKPASVSQATRKVDTCAEALEFPQACALAACASASVAAV